MSQNHATSNSENTVTEFRPQNYGKTFMTTFDECLGFLSSVPRPGAYYNVLFACLLRLRPDEFRAYSVTEVMHDTGGKRSTIERAFAMLEADNILISKGKGSGKRRRINSNLNWRGTVADFHRFRDGLDRPDPFPCAGWEQRTGQQHQRFAATAMP